ncbi:phosphatase 2C-like domain-containing protein [Pelagophyceae sp. CCMP2097]|nr:phosphatase 2C-like domain-containing protein [Pelagophyceae sp. CCMP2097]
MSRSFGDSIVHGLGVAADPEVSEHAVQQGDLFLILATDGVWDVKVLDNAAAVALVHQHLTHSTGDWNTHDAAAEAADVLCHAARRRWETLSPMIDDITALIVDLRGIS